MITVIAPHPDDELIGCFTLFEEKKVKEVIYINSDTKRLIEAQRMIKNRGIKMRVVTIEDLSDLIKKDLNVIYLVPSLSDRHPLHKLVSLIVSSKDVQVGYYTTGMDTDYVRVLSPEMAEKKRKMLDKYYKSQRSLWKYDHKYYLFEGIVYDLLDSTIASKK